LLALAPKTVSANRERKICIRAISYLLNSIDRQTSLEQYQQIDVLIKKVILKQQRAKHAR
jgi:hypothetical protein